MKQKINYFVFIFPLLLLIGSINVAACVCMPSGIPQCARYSLSDTVFVGRISAIQKPSKKQLKESDDLPNQFVYFNVEHPFKNINLKKVRIATDYKTSCAYSDLSVGQRWLVYADKDDENGLYFGMCGGSYTIDNKKELNEILAELPPVKDKQQIFLAVKQFGGYETLKEAKAFTVVNGQKIEAVKDDQYLTFDVPSAGKYKIQISIPYRASLADVYGSPLSEISVSENESIFETEMEVGIGECSFRQVEGYKRTSSANSINSLFSLANFPLYRLQN